MRDPKLQTFIDRLEAALLSKPDAFDGRHVAEMVFPALKDVPGERGDVETDDFPVLANLPRAIELARSQSERTTPVADALEPLLPLLPWWQSDEYDDPAFNAGHANAVIVGKGGLEQRTDFTIGISLTAPNTAYPLHNHPPEELYLAVAGGEFRHGDDDWSRVATGGTFYNTPGIIHSMRAATDPLLAIWIFGRR